MKSRVIIKSILNNGICEKLYVEHSDSISREQLKGIIKPLTKYQVTVEKPSKKKFYKYISLEECLVKVPSIVLMTKKIHFKSVRVLDECIISFWDKPFDLEIDDPTYNCTFIKNINYLLSTRTSSFYRIEISRMFNQPHLVTVNGDIYVHGHYLLVKDNRGRYNVYSYHIEYETTEETCPIYG